MNNAEAAESLEQMAEIADYDLVAEEVEACRMGAAALRALPAPEVPEVPEAVREWAIEYDQDDDAVNVNLRDWIRKEYGL